MSVESRVRCSPFSAGCVCLMDSGESLVLVYDEIPSRCIRLFNGRAEEVMRVENIPCSLVDLCYSSSFSRFFLLSPSSLSQFDPSVGELQPVIDYDLLKTNRSMSSLCSLSDRRLLILYRFGEYLDEYPSANRIWKRRHLCSSLSEDISCVRSSQG